MRAVLSWRTRLIFWLSVAAVAAVGLYAGDTLVPESEEERRDRVGSSQSGSR